MEAESNGSSRTRQARSSFTVKRASISVVAFVAFVAPVAFVARVAARAGWVAARRGEAGRDLNAVYFASDKRGWIAGDGGQVLRTEDGGRTWLAQQAGTDASINDIYFRDGDDGYLLAGNQILTTEDGGATWGAAHTFAPAEFDGAVPELYSVRFASKKRGWIVGSVSRRDDVVDSLLIYTDDGGASWLRRTLPARFELLHLDFHGEKRGWIVGDRGTILHTEDAGATWARQDSGTTATLYHVDFVDDDNGWAVGERSTILRTSDGGRTWVRATAPSIVGANATLLSVAFVNRDDGWIVGRRGVILRSDDGGRTWIRQESTVSGHLFALFFTKKAGWAVGGDGQVLQYER
ncbi:MAG: WD40/YVTN/BNR-like repeat-containing protein [Pyrinomonadaceae bacterium]